MITIDDQRVWLERIMTSPIIGFVVKDESGALVQCLEGDPQFRLALIEWQTQRIRELVRSEGKPAPEPLTEAEEMNIMIQLRYGTFIDPSLLGFTADGSGGQAGDDAALSQALSDLAWKANNAGTDLSTTPRAQP